MDNFVKNEKFSQQGSLLTRIENFDNNENFVKNGQFSHKIDNYTK